MPQSLCRKDFMCKMEIIPFPTLERYLIKVKTEWFVQRITELKNDVILL